MGNLTIDDLRGLAARHGIADVDTAAAIAMAESGGNPSAHGDTTIGSGQGSWGLWQVYLDAHPEYASQDLTDPDTNAAAMAAISSGGTNWTPWSTFNSGAYLHYMPATPTSLLARAVDMIRSVPTPVKVLGGGAIFLGGLAMALPRVAGQVRGALFGR